MNLTQLLVILRARVVILLLMLTVTVAVTLVISLLMPKSYEAVSTVVINNQGMDPVSGQFTPGMMMPAYMATQMDIIRSKGVAMKVVDRLGLAANPAVQRDYRNQSGTQGQGDIREWLASLLLRNLTVTPARDSSVVDIVVRGGDPQFSAVVANAFAAEYQAMTVQLKVQPLQQATMYFTEQLKQLRDNLENAQGRLSRYQQEKGLVNVDSRFDVESRRLNELSTQLVVVQGELSEALSRGQQAKGSGAGDSPDVVTNALVQNLTASLAQAQARLSEVSQRFNSNHPSYLSAKAEVDQLRTELNKQVQLTSNSLGGNTAILQRREAELTAAVAAQKERMLVSNRGRDELMVLVRDVENAQRAYDATLQRMNQTSLEGQSNHNDVMILSPATPPVQPAGPKILLNTGLALFVGLMLGVGAAFVMETFDRRIRSESDLGDLYDAPVLNFRDFRMAESRPRFNFSRFKRLAAR